MKAPFTPLPIRTLALLGLVLAPLTASLPAQQAKLAPAVKADPAAASAPGEEEGEPAKPSKLDCNWLPFPDAAKFKVLGLWWFEENSPNLWRLPKARFDTLPSGVRARARCPSGGRILLRCNTSQLGLKVTPLAKGAMKGFDVYVNGRYVRSAVAEEPKRETEVVLFRDLDRKEKEILIYLPYHQEISISALGVDKDTRFSAPEHQFARPKPVVFYGSSVCQGSGAYKAGMTYTAKLCRDLNLDFVNLGFGGAGKAEPNVVELVNSIPACCYVFDLGKSYGDQDGAAFRQMLESVRKAHPGVPLFCLTPITSSREVDSASYSSRSRHTREAMRQATQEFIQSGQKGVYLLEGEDLLGFGEHDGLSRDGVHPTDYGYSLIAGKLLPRVKAALGL